MDKNLEKNQLKFSQWWFLLTAILMGIAGWENRLEWENTVHHSWHLFGYGWLLLTILAVFIALLVFTNFYAKIQSILKSCITKLTRFGWFNLLYFALAALAFPLLLFRGSSEYFDNFFFRLAILWLFASIAAVGLKSFYPSYKYKDHLVLSLLVTMALFQSVSTMRDISTYSLSLGWSEGSRFYYASLPFANSIYGKHLPLSILHPSRYLLMSLPFVIKGLPLWVHRAWQVFLWISLIAMGAISLARRLKLTNWIQYLAVIAWCFVFFFQGPVYYHLMICVIIVMWGYSNDKFIQSLLAVIGASLWAGISRVNWFPLPAALASVLFFLETPFDQSKGFWNYFRKPVIFGTVGLVTSLASQAAYIFLSGNKDISAFGTSFTSNLLWYRLLPSPTYPTGILPGILLLGAPLIVMTVIYVVGKDKFLHYTRRFFIASIILIFFAGGLVVSVKIGGGSNLHNLDAFLVLMTCVCSYFLFDNYAKDKMKQKTKGTFPKPLLLFIIVLPIIWSLWKWAPFPALNKSSAQRDVIRLQEEIQDAASNKEEILFISERQLLTVNAIRDVPLVEEYELLTLMEMAMSNNQSYLQGFYEDLDNQRFGLIVTNKQYVVFKDASRSFPEENNAWVQHVVVPLMKSYKPVTWLRDSGIEIYARRDSNPQ